MHSKIKEIKKNESPPKIIKNLFSKNEINKFLNLYEQLPTTVHNKKQNVMQFKQKLINILKYHVKSIKIN